MAGIGENPGGKRLNDCAGALDNQVERLALQAKLARKAHQGIEAARALLKADQSRRGHAGRNS